MIMLRSLFLGLLPLVIALAPSQPTPPIYRILFAGHSIVRNPPAPGEPYHWDGYWGERATYAHKDVVHQVWGGVCGRQGFCPEMEIFRAVTTAEVDRIPARIREYRPDLVVVFWGEAGGSGIPQEAWDALYLPIGEAAREVGARAIAIGMWGTRPIGDRDEKLRTAALAAGMEYVYIADLHAVRTAEMCQGLQAGVCEHPDDSEMEAIAQRVLGALYNSKHFLPLVHGGEGGTVPP